MSTQVQRRKGTTAQHASFTGASAELTVDTTKNTVVVHDGATAGGIPLAKETGSAISVTSLVSSGASVIEATDTSAALRITQLGTGNALLIEDSANPDSTPVVVDTAGRVAVGHIATVAGTGPSTSTRPSLQVHGLSNSLSGSGVYNWSSTASLTSAVTFNRSLSNTVGTFGGALTSGTSIGALSFSGDDSTSFFEAARIQVQADATASAGSMPGRMLFSTTPAGTTTPVERMRIDSTGAITIAGGTANAVAFLNGSKVLTTGAALTFDGTTFAALSGGTTIVASKSASGQQAFVSAVGNAGTIGTSSFDMIQDGTGIAYLYQRANQPMLFGVNNTEQMRLTSTGLGIGTSSPAAKLDVAGAVIFQGEASNGGTVNIGNTAAYRGILSYTGSGNTVLSIKNSFDSADAAINFIMRSAGTPVTALTITGSGNLGLGVTPSAWDGTYTAIQLPNGGALSGYKGSAAPIVGLTSNMYYYGGSSNYVINGLASSYYQNQGAHTWSIAPSGTAGNAITFTQAMTLDASGNLLVGTTDSSLGTRFVSSAANNAGAFINTAAAAATMFIWSKATAGDNFFLEFATETSLTQRGSITYNRAGGLTVYNTTSDYRAKDISGPVLDSGALIDSVPVYMGKMKDATQERPMFIAHETPAYAHTGVKDAVDKDGKPVYQQMDASALIPVMWAEIQDLRKRLAAAGI